MLYGNGETHHKEEENEGRGHGHHRAIPKGDLNSSPGPLQPDCAFDNASSSSMRKERDHQDRGICGTNAQWKKCLRAAREGPWIMKLHLLLRKMQKESDITTHVLPGRPDGTHCSSGPYLDSRPTFETLFAWQKDTIKLPPTISKKYISMIQREIPENETPTEIFAPPTRVHSMNPRWSSYVRKSPANKSS